MQLKHVQDIEKFPKSPRVGEGLFQKMLITWTKLDRFWIHNPLEQLGQRQLEQMSDYWPNPHYLMLGKRPENLLLTANLKNLKAIACDFYLPREETIFLRRTCQSLYRLAFLNKATDLISVFLTRKKLQLCQRSNIDSNIAKVTKKVITTLGPFLISKKSS